MTGRLRRGFGVVAKLVALDPTLSTNAKAMYLALACYADDHAECFPSNETLAEATGLSMSTVKRALTELCAAGVIERERRYDGSRETTSLTRLTDAVAGRGNDTTINGEEVTVTSRESIGGPLGGLTGGPHEGVTGDPQNKTTSNKTTRNRERRASALPSDFVITDAMKAWWDSKEASTTVNLQRETEQFMDFHRARGTTFKDWTAAWRTWMTNAIKYSNSNRPRNSRAREVVYPR